VSVSGVKNYTTNPVGMSQCAETLLERFSAQAGRLHAHLYRPACDRQVPDLQRDTLLSAGVEERHPFHLNLTGDCSWGVKQRASENPGGLRALRAPPEVVSMAA
jgi:hypothetical protein